MTAGTAIQEFDGTLTTVLTGATAVLANANYAVAGTNATITEIDFQASGDKWPMARAIFTGQFATITSIHGKTLDLFLVPTDVDGTDNNDSQMPTTTVLNGGHYVGSFVVTTGVANTDMYLEIQGSVISLVGRKKAKFSLYNNTGQSVSTGWTVKIEGVSFVGSAA
jgi:hypothetical protein